MCNILYNTKDYNHKLNKCGVSRLKRSKCSDIYDILIYFFMGDVIFNKLNKLS